MPIEIKKGWSTFMPILIKAVSLTNGDVLEMGAGYFSTPLLHWICKYKNLLFTYENDPLFYSFAKQFQSPKHVIKLVNNWDDIKINKHWGVVFIDHVPDNRRGKDIIRFKNNADYIVIHDSERENTFGYIEAWGHFKYRYDWKDCRPWTTVLSNFKGLQEFSNL